MKKSYFIIPTTNIFNHRVIVELLRHAYKTKTEALAKASYLSKQYNEDFFVCTIESKVSTKSTIIDLN